MADNEKIIAVGFEAKPGNAPQQAEQAGKQTGDAFARGANEALKKLDVAGKFKAEAGGKSFLDNLFDVSKAKTDAAAKAISDSIASMPKVQLPVPSVPKEVLGDVERATLGINSFLTGMRAFATFFDKNASLLAVGQLGAQAVEYGQRYQRAQAEAATAARVARAEAAVSRASSMDIVAEMSGAGGLRGAASAFGGGALEAGAFGAGAAAAAESSLFSSLKALATRLAPAAAVIGGGATVITEAVKTRNEINDLALEGAEKFKHRKLLQEVMGATPKDMDELKARLGLVGGSAAELENTFFRVAARARRQRLEITHEVEDSADREVEANVRVNESGRALANAHDQVALSVDRAKKASGDLIKVQQTEQQVMEQQRRAADLAVSGALIGERGAQMRATQAAINLRFAPEQARIADIQGPSTVEGARLGATGARIALEEARARYYGQEPDESLQDRKRLHALQVARHNAEQADIQERQAELNERKRVAEKAAGVGPEAQAQLAAFQAQQGQELASLQVQRTEVAREILRIEQETKGYAEKEREAKANADKANRDVDAARDAERKAQAEKNLSVMEEQRLRNKNIESIQKAIRGELEPGFDITKVDQGALTKAITREGDFTVTGIIEALRKYRESPLITGLPEKEQAAQMFATVQQQIGRMGLGGQAGQLTDLIMSRTQLTPELKQILADREAARQAITPEQGKQQQQTVQDIFAQRTEDEFKLEAERKRARDAAMKGANDRMKSEGAEATFIQKTISNTVEMYTNIDNYLRDVQQRQKKAIDTYRGTTVEELINANKPTQSGGSLLLDAINRYRSSTVEDLINANQGIKEGTPDVRGAINELVGAIKEGAKDVGGAKKSSGAGAGGGGGGPELRAEEMLEAEGGLLHGLGSGTSDQIPIMASPGEYVVNAKSVSNPGILSLLEQINAGKYQEGGMVTGLDMALRDSEREWSRAAATGPMKTGLDMALHQSEQEWRQAVKTSPMVTGLDVALRQAEAGWAAAVRTTGMRTGLDEALQQAEENWRKSVKSHFQSGGAVAHGPAPDATITRNPFVSSEDVSYQERVLMEHDGFDPDNPADVKLWRERVGSKLPPNMGMPGGPTGSGAIARAQVARGPAPPILIVKPGVGTDYTIPTPAGGARVKYNPLAGTYWPEGSGKPYDENDKTTFGKPGVKFDPMNSSTWSPGYMNDFYSTPGYTDIKTSDKDLATPIHFGRRTGDPVLDTTIPRSKEAQEKFPQGSWYKFDDKEGWFRQGPGDHVLRQPGPPPADTQDKVFSFGNRPENEQAKIQQMIDTSREEERKKIEEEQNRYPEATGGLIGKFADGGAVMPIRVMKGPAAGVIETTQSALEYARAEWRRTHGDEKPPDTSIQLSDEATGGLIRRYFLGGPVGMQAGGFPPAPDMGGAITKAALSDLSERLGNIPSRGSALTPSASALSGLNTLGVHQLDLRTNAGNFPAAVSEETWAAIQRTSLMNQVSSIGSRPSWYS